MNKFVAYVAVALFSLSLCVLSGCSEKEQIQEPKADDESADRVETSVVYVGNETLEDVEHSLQELRTSSAPPFTVEQEEQILESFQQFQKEQQKSLNPLSWYPAYTSHYVWSGHDYDLWLEYKWWVGSRQSYHFETPIWALYWAVRVCYGGNITNWTWMEGGHQRVTAIVGTCVYVPFGDAFVRYYLRVVSP